MGFADKNYGYIAIQEIDWTNLNPNKERRRFAPPLFIWVL
ncbi:hypothetical protein APA_1517 [Pseudanabaena sp. lw0831]|nr:hypothetical protein APA_1517 [Pseudanabaena sp. lw0831]